jgi:ABC-type sulfate transport system permease component
MKQFIIGLVVVLVLIGVGIALMTGDAPTADITTDTNATTTTQGTTATTTATTTLSTVTTTHLNYLQIRHRTPREILRSSHRKDFITVRSFIESLKAS